MTSWEQHRCFIKPVEGDGKRVGSDGLGQVEAQAGDCQMVQVKFPRVSPKGKSRIGLTLDY